jgi:hypothetical protein
VDVERKQSSVAGEQQRASGGLRSDAFEARQELRGFIERRALQKMQIEGPSAIVYFSK